ncbi:MAG: phosphoglycerate kinase, partial [Variovorax sp.]|nr:phosphoglycerate kinase [Variovorax sp.]
AQTEAPPGLCYGATDVGVPAGASWAVARRVAPALGADVAIRHSPLRRCAELARAIGVLRPGLEVHADGRLAEMDFGAWEGRAWSSIDRVEFDAWTGDFANARAGLHGESTRAFMQRVGEAFDEARRSGREALWVTHAGVIRAAQLLERGVRCVERADQWSATAVGFGECVTLEL